MRDLVGKGAKSPRGRERASDSSPVPGKHTLSETLPQDSEPVQRREANAAPDSEAVHASAQRGTATPSSPLPHAETIQRLFGRYDISSVKAHTGGEAAASAHAMGARAYATGNHVVLGDAGADLHTVAHEAAHVVQQRGGVALAGGVGQEGDAHERNADAVADAVVAGHSAEALLSSYAAPTAGAQVAGAVQRAPVPHRQADAALDPYAKAFSDMVDHAAAQVLQIDTVPDDNGGMYDRWSAVATEYLGNNASVPAFLYAAYGYAIEKAVTDNIHNISGLLPSGWSVLSQVSHGMTRPDFVLSDAHGERAWLDVTSAGSTGHIFNKAGSGWKSRDYVFEIVYTALDVSRIVANGDMISGVKARSKHKSLEKKKEIAFEKLRANLVDLESLYETAKPAATMKAFKTYFEGYTFSHDMIRSLIELAGLDLSSFGYKRADANGRDRPSAMQFMYEHYINDISLYV